MASARVDGLVSIVVTCFNRRRYIRRCLNRLIQQSYPNIEIIVVDDHSSDGTARVIRNFHGKLPASWKSRFIPVQLPRNTGYAGALTTGLYLTHGEFIAFQDSDDFSHRERIAQQVAYLRSNSQVGIVGTNYAIVDEQGKVNQAASAKTNWLIYGQEAVRQTYAAGGHCICCGTMMIQGRLFDVAGGPSRRMDGAEDYELIAKLLNTGSQADNIPQVLYYYRTHQNQRSHQFYPAR